MSGRLRIDNNIVRNARPRAVPIILKSRYATMAMAIKYNPAFKAILKQLMILP